MCVCVYARATHIAARVGKTCMRALYARASVSRRECIEEENHGGRARDDEEVEKAGEVEMEYSRRHDAQTSIASLSQNVTQNNSPIKWYCKLIYRFAFSLVLFSTYLSLSVCFSVFLSTLFRRKSCTQWPLRSINVAKKNEISIRNTSHVITRRIIHRVIAEFGGTCTRSLLHFRRISTQRNWSESQSESSRLQRLRHFAKTIFQRSRTLQYYTTRPRHKSEN